MKIEFTRDELDDMIRAHISATLPGLTSGREITSLRFERYSTSAALVIELEAPVAEVAPFVELDEVEKVA